MPDVALLEINRFATPVLTYPQGWPMKHRIAKHYFGCTTEGCPFQLVAIFEGDTDTPVQILGSYASSDGGSQFDVKEERDIP